MLIDVAYDEDALQKVAIILRLSSDHNAWMRCPGHACPFITRRLCKEHAMLSRRSLFSASVSLLGAPVRMCGYRQARVDKVQCGINQRNLSLLSVYRCLWLAVWELVVVLSVSYFAR